MRNNIMAELMIKGKDVSGDVLSFAQELVRIKSFSGQEEGVARAIVARMEALGYDAVTIDRWGNVLGKIGIGEKVLLFESHTDTVQVNDADQWQAAPFSAEIKDGLLWGRGSADMKSGIAASVYAPAVAKSNGALSGKTVYVSCSIFEEDCDGVGLHHLLEDTGLKPDYAVICEPSNNQIALGHNGKAQIIVKTEGISAHGCAPEKGQNAVYEMAQIIQRVEQTNLSLKEINGRKGTLVLSRISSTGASLNAVPSECEIYLDRRLVPGETEQTVQAEMEHIIAGKKALWEIDMVNRTTWTGASITYHPLHAPWEIETDHHLTQTLIQAYSDVYGRAPEAAAFTYWNFSTNAVALIRKGIPTIGFGPGDPKLAHMRNERCPLDQIVDACAFYAKIIENI